MSITFTLENSQDVMSRLIRDSNVIFCTLHKWQLLIFRSSNAGEPNKLSLSLVGSQVSGSRHAHDTSDDEDDLSEDIVYED
jgi:hypothetical protein